GSWCGKPRSGSSSAIRWSNPFVVDPIAASWHIVSAGSLVVYCWWSRSIPPGHRRTFCSPEPVSSDDVTYSNTSSFTYKTNSIN
ncbi:hypothetical protein J3Q64DRAFT_1823473, partial [Phycomyces blakesleeanus]